MKKITYLLLILFFSFEAYPQQVSTEFDYEALDSKIEKAVQKFNLTGLSISIVQNGEVAFSKAYGYKDFQNNIPLETASLFNIASCSKAFTSACMALLVNEGKIKWNDRIIDYLPDFKLADECITNKLTLEDLLCHRSGLGTFYGDLLWYNTSYKPDEIIHRMRYLPVTNSFRNEYGYQNDMYIVAGQIIEKVTGKTWGEFLRERILQPLQMSETRVASKYLTDSQNIAYPHLKKAKQDLYIIDEQPALSMYSSTEELTKWIKMLLNNGEYQGIQILPKQAVNDIFSARTLLNVSPFHVSAGTKFRAYALGWSTFDFAGRKIVEHDGGMPGYISKVTLIPEENFGFTILTNDMNYLPSALRYEILDMLFGTKKMDWISLYYNFKVESEKQEKAAKEKKYAERLKDTKPTHKLKNYTGIYTDKMYGDAEIKIEKSQLFITLLPAKEAFFSTMEHWHNDSFHIKFKDEFLPEGWINFYFDNDGNIEGFKIDLENPDFHFFNLDFKKQ